MLVRRGASLTVSRQAAVSGSMDGLLVINAWGNARAKEGQRSKPLNALSQLTEYRSLEGDDVHYTSLGFSKSSGCVQTMMWSINKPYTEGTIRI